MKPLALILLCGPGWMGAADEYAAPRAEWNRPVDYQVVFPCSLSAPGYQLVNNARYPGIVRDFELTFKKLRALPCEVFLGSHSWDFGLAEKRRAQEAGASANPFVDPQGYRAWLDRSEAAFRRQLEEQHAR